MAKRPLVSFTLIFCLGILAASHLRLNFWLVYFPAAAFVTLGLFCKRRLFMVLILAVAFLLGVLFAENYETLPVCHILNYFSAGKNLCLVHGVISDEPVMRHGGSRFVFVTKSVNFGSHNFPCCGEVLVELKGGQDFRYGDELLLKGALCRVKDHFYASGYREYLRNRGIHAFLSVGTPLYAARLNQNQGNRLTSLALNLKEKAKEIICRYLPPSSASVLSAMILGERKGLSSQVYQAMVRIGTIHILVVSGFNVGIIGFILALSLKILRVKRKARFYFIVPILVMYCLITGAANPVIRATVMAVVFLSAYLVKREPDIYNSSALAALFILVLNPRQLFDIGFQLSFASVLAIICLYPWLKRRLRLEGWRVRPLRYLAEAALVCFSAWLGTAPLVFWNFRIFSPVAIIANLFIVPLATLIILGGLALMIIAFPLPLLAPALAASCESLIGLLFVLTYYFGR